MAPAELDSGKQGTVAPLAESAVPNDVYDSEDNKIISNQNEDRYENSTERSANDKKQQQQQQQSKADGKLEGVHLEGPFFFGPPDQGADQKSANDKQQQPSKLATEMGSSEMSRFDEAEAENGGYERENFATCLVERSQGDGQQIEDQSGRLNFWQPINNRGVMHLAAHYTYKLVAAKDKQARSRRESFRAPIERAPSDNPAALDKLIRSSHLERDQIWLVASCEGNFTPPIQPSSEAGTPPSATGSASSKLLAELTRQQVDPSTVEIDSELIVGQFNLTGVNEIANKHLLLLRRQDERLATRIACCKVIQTNTMPASGLPERANKTIQATRDFHQSASSTAQLH